LKGKENRVFSKKVNEESKIDQKQAEAIYLPGKGDAQTIIRAKQSTIVTGKKIKTKLTPRGKKKREDTAWDA